MTVLEDLAPPPKVEVWLAAIAALEGLPTPRSCPATGSPATAACTATRAPTSPPHVPPSPRPTASTGT